MRNGDSLLRLARRPLSNGPTGLLPSSCSAHTQAAPHQDTRKEPFAWTGEWQVVPSWKGTSMGLKLIWLGNIKKMSFKSTGWNSNSLLIFSQFVPWFVLILPKIHVFFCSHLRFPCQVVTMFWTLTRSLNIYLSRLTTDQALCQVLGNRAITVAVTTVKDIDKLLKSTKCAHGVCVCR